MRNDGRVGREIAVKWLWQLPEVADAREVVLTAIAWSSSCRGCISWWWGCGGGGGGGGGGVVVRRSDAAGVEV